MCNVKTKVIPVTTGATGTISKSLRKYLSKVPVITISRNYTKQLYWHCTRTADSTDVKYSTLNMGTALHVAYIVTTE
jgi:hypothetical protein